jgi:glyoxylase-like metal-dependent hydrolase (beta-lactamase superfamily II)
MEQLIRLPVPVFVIETDRERILVDTGVHPGAVADPAGRYGSAEAIGPIKAELDASIAEQVQLDTLSYVVLTHLHFDHVAGLDLVPASVPIVVQRREWQAGHDPEVARRNFYLPADYAGTERPVIEVDGDHDLLGDGSVRLLLTPGHSPGHQSVMLEEKLVIGGDVSHFASGLDDHRFPRFGDDHEAQAISADRLRVFRDAGGTVLPGHDPEVLRPGPLLL